MTEPVIREFYFTEDTNVFILYNNQSRDLIYRFIEIYNALYTYHSLCNSAGSLNVYAVTKGQTVTMTPVRKHSDYVIKTLNIYYIVICIKYTNFRPHKNGGMHINSQIVFPRSMRALSLIVSHADASQIIKIVFVYVPQFEFVFIPLTIPLYLQ